MLIQPSIRWIETVLSLTNSLIALSHIVMCLMSFVVIDFDQQTHALFSLKIYTRGVFDMQTWLISISVSIFCNRRSPLTHLSVAQISASAEVRLVSFCSLDTHYISPFCMTMKPDMDLVTKDHSYFGWAGSGMLWSCSP